MADLSDVETALVDTVIAVVNSDGIETPGLLGAHVNVFRGSPISGTPRPFAQSSIEIGIFPEPGSSRNTTRWNVQSYYAARKPGLVATAVDNTATFLGIALPGDVAGILLGDCAFVYTAQDGDSAGLVAAALADQIRTVAICWLNDSTLTVPGYTSLVARTGAPSSVLEEWCRQEQCFRITIFATAPQLRDKACGLISAALAATPFILLSDGTSARVRYHSTASNDEDQAASMYRREIVYNIEYGTTLLRTAPTVLFGDLDYNGQTLLI